MLFSLPFTLKSPFLDCRNHVSHVLIDGACSSLWFYRQTMTFHSLFLLIKWGKQCMPQVLFFTHKPRHDHRTIQHRHYVWRTQLLCACRLMSCEQTDIVSNSYATYYSVRPSLRKTGKYLYVHLEYVLRKFNIIYPNVVSAIKVVLHSKTLPLLILYSIKVIWFIKWQRPLCDSHKSPSSSNSTHETSTIIKVPQFIKQPDLDDLVRDLHLGNKTCRDLKL